jgi:hypothetical protein
LNEEVENGDGDLLSTSEEQGGAWNGGARRRAPATVSFHGREGEADGGEEGGRPRNRRKGGGGDVQVQAPGGLLGLEAASRRWPCSIQESSMQVLPVTHEEDNRLFAKSPLAIGDFSKMF